jgi:REP element-mobilizing transposase RayT
MPEPLAYFITFRTFGTWLPGDARGYVDRDHRARDSPFAERDAGVEQRARTTMRAGAFVLERAMRAAVDASVRETCMARGWTMLALNVRTNHVHVVVAAGHSPERVMTDLKAWATRRLVADGLIRRGRPVWSRHGSTRWLWDERDVTAACAYVEEAQ